MNKKTVWKARVLSKFGGGDVVVIGCCDAVVTEKTVTLEDGSLYPFGFMRRLSVNDVGMTKREALEKLLEQQVLEHDAARHTLDAAKARVSAVKAELKRCNKRGRDNG